MHALWMTEAVEGAAGHTGGVAGAEHMDIDTVEVRVAAAEDGIAVADIADMLAAWEAGTGDIGEDRTAAEGTVAAAAAAVVE